MSCPEDLAWMQYLEGPDRAPALTAHLATCAACRAAHDAARAAMAALTNLSPGSRRLCPPPEELAQIPEGIAMLSVRLHAAVCADCREDLADLAALEIEPATRIVARWLADGFRIVSQTLSNLAPEPVPALAARGGAGGATGWTVRQPLDDAELKLELAPGDSHSFALAVSLAPKPPPGTRVDLEASDRLLESRTMDATGLLSFLALPPGHYRVTVRRPSQSPITTEIEVSG